MPTVEGKRMLEHEVAQGKKTFTYIEGKGWALEHEAAEGTALSLESRVFSRCAQLPISFISIS